MMQALVGLFAIGMAALIVLSLLGWLFDLLGELISWLFHLITFGIFRAKPKPPVYSSSDHYYPSEFDRQDHHCCHCDHEEEDSWR